MYIFNLFPNYKAASAIEYALLYCGYIPTSLSSLKKKKKRESATYTLSLPRLSHARLKQIASVTRATPLLGSYSPVRVAKNVTRLERNSR